MTAPNFIHLDAAPIFLENKELFNFDLSFLIDYLQKILNWLTTLFSSHKDKTTLNECPPKEIKKIETLAISSSGGGGHLTAMDAVLQTIEDKSTIHVPDRTQFQALKSSISLDWFIQSFCEFGVLQSILYHTCFPQMPPFEIFIAEAEKLKKKHRADHPYVDVLLDLNEDGYASCAYWNTLQQLDDTKSLKKMIHFLPKMDRDR